ncbi:unnamed protein product [Victoria cruziana]
MPSLSTRSLDAVSLSAVSLSTRSLAVLLWNLTVLEGRVLNIWWGLRASLEVHDWRNRGFLLRPKDIFFRAIKSGLESQ